MIQIQYIYAEELWDSISAESTDTVGLKQLCTEVKNFWKALISFVGNVVGNLGWINIWILQRNNYNLKIFISGYTCVQYVIYVFNTALHGHYENGKNK